MGIWYDWLKFTELLMYIFYLQESKNMSNISKIKKKINSYSNYHETYKGSFYSESIIL